MFKIQFVVILFVSIIIIKANTNTSMLYPHENKNCYYKIYTTNRVLQCNNEYTLK